MEKKLIKKPVKKQKKKVLQKQKQKQTVKVVVNVGSKDGKPSVVRNTNPELVMYSPPPNIFTKGNISGQASQVPAGFRDQESNAPIYNMPSSARPTQMPFMNEPVRQPNFFPEDTSTVEFLPDYPVREPFQPYLVQEPVERQRQNFQEPVGIEIPNTEEEIVNDITDDPYQINAGIIDDFDERLGQTDYIQTQAPTYDMTIYNPIQDNNIDDEIELMRERFGMRREDLMGQAYKNVENIERNNMMNEDFYSEAFSILENYNKKNEQIERNNMMNEDVLSKPYSILENNKRKFLKLANEAVSKVESKQMKNYDFNTINSFLQPSDDNTIQSFLPQTPSDNINDFLTFGLNTPPRISEITLANRILQTPDKSTDDIINLMRNTTQNILKRRSNNPLGRPRRIPLEQQVEKVYTIPIISKDGKIPLSGKKLSHLQFIADHFNVDKKKLGSNRLKTREELMASIKEKVYEEKINKPLPRMSPSQRKLLGF